MIGDEDLAERRAAIARYAAGMPDRHGRSVPDAAAARATVAGDVRAFLNAGGQVEQVPTGKSGFNPLRTMRQAVKSPRPKADRQKRAIARRIEAAHRRRAEIT